MLKQLLESKGFVENLDFTLVGEELTALERTRDVEMIDEQGNSSIVQETYLVQLPSVAELKLELVKANDPAMLIAEYLKDKQTEENDSLNVDLFLNGGPGWRFESVAAPSIDQLYALISVSKAAIDQQKINEESLAYLASTDFYIIREADAGTPCPPDIRAARAAARAAIVK
jgi:hypothetical protein